MNRNYLAIIIWGILAVVTAYLILRLTTGVSHYDFSGYGTVIYVITLGLFLAYSMVLGAKQSIKLGKLMRIFSLAVFLAFFILFILLHI